MWNRIRSAAEWVPSDTVSEADVISGKTFHNTSRTQKTGTLSYVGNATVSDVQVGQTFYSNDGTLKTGTKAVIGDTYGGGKIAYVLVSGDPGYDANVTHGLIAATSDQSTGTTWGCAATKVSGADGTAIGTGHQNTHDMAAAGCTNAAGIANSYAGGGYTDWFIPSKDELNKLYINQNVIGGFSIITTHFYVTSSEQTDYFAWAQKFETGTQSEVNKGNSVGVRLRVVRAF
jgi:hypothetical protein